MSPPKKPKVNNMLIKRILAYSAKKIKAKPPLLYSTLNPETNSDSPSAKSKGVRLVSAKEVVNHTSPMGSISTINQIYSCKIKKFKKLYPQIKKITDIKINTKLTS
jgi:hypothetical protein